MLLRDSGMDYVKEKAKERYNEQCLEEIRKLDEHIGAYKGAGLQRGLRYSQVRSAGEKPYGRRLINAYVADTRFCTIQLHAPTANSEMEQCTKLVDIYAGIYLF